MLDEFKMMWDLRYRFPLHYIVFRPGLESHIPQEANVKQYFFSCAGKLSDTGGRQQEALLADGAGHQGALLPEVPRWRRLERRL